jgi:hypothetical protein
MTDAPPFKPVVWVGLSVKDLREFPDAVQDHMAMRCMSLSEAAGIGTQNR